MDGKQARRTRTSSALGELFDHGVDSWASFLFPVCIFSVLSQKNDGISPMSMHLLLLSIYITFIDTHWEKYNTKVLFLPWSYDISMLVRIITIEKHQFRDDFLFIYLVDDFNISINIFLYTKCVSF
jgi:ethanolaminephosphotransferase